MIVDRPVRGIALMFGFCLVAPMGDAVAKLLSDTPLGEVLLVRFFIQSLILFPLIWISKRHWRIPAGLMGLVVLRTVLHMLGIATMFTGLQYLPLADAVAIAFVCPFILLLLGRVFLQEAIGPHRLGACAVGFLGTLMVVQPSFVDVGLPALWPVATAVIFALFVLITRKVAKDTDPLGLQAVSGVVACVLLIPILGVGQNWQVDALQLPTPTQQQWGLLLSIGILGTLAHLLMTWSLRYAPSATLAPMQYLEIPIATLIGWLVFNQFPNTLAGLGIMVTMAAGLYAVWRERQVSLTQPAEA